MFFDFDGTLSPLDASRESARVRDDVAEVLRELGKRFFLALASSKDCRFLMSRADYFNAYICVNGLEIFSRDYLIYDPLILESERIKALSQIIYMARSVSRVFVEEKISLTDRVLGVSIDWRETSSRPREIDGIIGFATSRGLQVIEYDGYPFVDIYVSRRNKGDAIRLIRSLYSIDRIVYFGDSKNDLPAFEVADISVLVRHRFNRDLRVETDYEVEFEELGRWLREYAALL